MSDERTSGSHPLRIDAVETPEGGHVGMTLCPGRCDMSSAEGAWARDLEADLRAIAAWKPSFLVTLVERHEFDLLGVPASAAAVARARVPWRHLPITDAGTPDDAFEDRAGGPPAWRFGTRSGAANVSCCAAAPVWAVPAC